MRARHHTVLSNLSSDLQLIRVGVREGGVLLQLDALTCGKQVAHRDKH